MTSPQSRAYDLAFDRRYEIPPVPPKPPGPVRPPLETNLAGIIWHGLECNPGHVDGAFTAIVENVEGWYATPEFEGRDTERTLTDGAAWGAKTLNARHVAITGAAVGPRAQIMSLRDQLAWRAALREPVELAISDPWLGGLTLSAMVRAGTDSFHHAFIGGRAGFRWQVTLTADDPVLYERDWRQVRLTTATPDDAGRRYPRFYTEHEPDLSGWRYGNPYPEGSAAYLANPGNADAPVWALYEGDLTQSRLDDGGGYAIALAPLAAGEQILVDTARLTAEAEGGQPRASFILPGSRRLVIPPFTTARWALYSQGSGSVTLGWRSAWL